MKRSTSSRKHIAVVSLPKAVLIGLTVLLPARGFAQQPMTLEGATTTAIQNNEGLKAASYDVEYFKALKKTAVDIPKLNAVWMHGQYNSIYQDNNYTVSQVIPFPTTLSSQVRLGKEEVIGAQRNLDVVRTELTYEVKSAWFNILYLRAKHSLLMFEDSLYTGFARASRTRFKVGESNLLEQTTVETQSLESRNQLMQNESERNIAAVKLQALLKVSSPVVITDSIRMLGMPADTSVQANPRLAYLKQQVLISEAVKKVERNRLMPDINFGYFNQSLIGVQNINGQDQYFGKGKHFQGFQVGLAIPLWLSPHLARARSAAIHEEVQRYNASYFQTTLSSSYHAAVFDAEKNYRSIIYFQTSALPNSELIIKQAGQGYSAGEVGYVEYFQSLKLAIGIKEQYLYALNQYNQSIIKIEYLLGSF